MAEPPPKVDAAMPERTRGRVGVVARRPALEVEGFATVVADRLELRRAPGATSEIVTIHCDDSATRCRPVEIGRKKAWTSLYLLDGPVAAERDDWYLAAADSEYSLGPPYIGWVPAGGANPWLVAQEAACPSPPVELEDVTYAALPRLTALFCLGGQQLTLRGWYPEPPQGTSAGVARLGMLAAPPEDDCEREPAWLICGGGAHMLRPAEASWYGDADHLMFRVHPELVEMPPPPGWIVVTGQFDHPAAAACADADPATHLSCRLEFVMTSARLDR